MKSKLFISYKFSINIFCDHLLFQPIINFIDLLQQNFYRFIFGSQVPVISTSMPCTYELLIPLILQYP